MRKRKATETAKASRTREEELEDEIIRLRKALNEVLKIGREQFGVDLLKKAGAKQ